MLLDGEQAGPQVTLGGQPDAVANFAEGVADRGDDPDSTLATVAKPESRGGGRTLIGHRLERKLAVDRLDDVAAGDDAVHGPDAVGIEWHELDEADLIALATGEAGEVDDLVVVAAAHHDHVELDGAEASHAGGCQATEHTIERIAAGEILEAVRVQRIQADVEPLQPGGLEGLRFCLEKDAIRGHRDVERLVDGGDHGGQLLDAPAHERLAAGQPDGADAAVVDEDARDAHDLLEAEHLVARQPGKAGGRHAVDAAKVAAVRDRDTQVIRNPPEGIAEMQNRNRTGHELSIWGVQLGVMAQFTTMETKVQSELPRGDAWQYEPKWDGFRAVAFKDGDEVVIHSRNQKPLTRYFPELVPALQKIKPKRAVLDGEIVIFTGFGTDFDAMTLRIHPAASRVNMLAAEQPSTYIAFDLLADGDESLIDVPLKTRRQRLEKLLGPKPGSIYLSPVTRDREVALSAITDYVGTVLDGIVAKKVDGIYHPGERAMIKVMSSAPPTVWWGVFAGATTASGSARSCWA